MVGWGFPAPLSTVPAQTQPIATCIKQPQSRSCHGPEPPLLMAPQKRTRQQVGDLSSESLPRKPPAKRIKTRTWESPPEFRDRLSKIALTHGALRELDRRTELSRTGLPRSRHSLACTTSPVKVTRALTRALTRLANDGGPDLSDLRGHPSPPAPDPTPVIMTSRHSS
ncbi:hypothetical protein BN1708_006801 [Verticillium longisporum]|uniref:Uncharacterized protein n=2 Tax=Verticillium longisporum TaxID=100787 RepID=A0A0G4MNR1_VERLO|nr:hypothetical protein BN1708_006801 [Verticillium longisporum]